MRLKILTAVAALAAVFCIALYAQEPVMALLEQRMQNRISADYSFYIDRDGTKILFSGNVLVQDDMFRIKGNGVEVYSDSAAFYVVDRKAKEVCIESCKKVEEYIKENVSNVQDLRISNVVRENKSQDISAFVFIPDELGAGWVITDLR